MQGLLERIGRGAAIAGQVVRLGQVEIAMGGGALGDDFAKVLEGPVGVPVDQKRHGPGVQQLGSRSIEFDGAADGSEPPFGLGGAQPLVDERHRETKARLELARKPLGAAGQGVPCALQAQRQADDEPLGLPFGDERGDFESNAYIGLAIFVVVLCGFAAGLSTPRLARKVGDLAARVASRGLRVVRKQPVTWDGEAFVSFRNRTNRLLKRRWPVLTLTTLAGHLTVFLVLLVSLRVLDVPSSEVSAAEAFAAWSFVRLLGSIPITPGGLGVVELGLTTALVGFGGDQAEVVQGDRLARDVAEPPP